QAGRYKAVTIATNMAGRGTDIVLGGNAEFLAKSLAKEKVENKEDPQEFEQKMKTFLEQFRRQTKEEHDKVVSLGGLHVLGTERHESRRIDNQLRGRQGRQGDPGSSRFYVSLEDDLMRLFAGDRIISIMNALGMEQGQVLEHPLLSRSIETAQKRVENHNFEIRKHLLEYDDVMNRQREVIYNMRRSVLESESVKNLIEEAIEDSVYSVVEQYVSSGNTETEPNIHILLSSLKQKFFLEASTYKDHLMQLDKEDLKEEILKNVLGVYAAKEHEMGAEQLRQMERMILLHTIDSKWKDHLYAMDQLKEGIGLRSFAQRDPLIEYKKEGFRMFEEMYYSINDEVVEMIFKIQSVKSTQKLKSVFGALPQKMIHEEMGSLSDRKIVSAESHESDSDQDISASAKQAPIRHDGPKVGRNDPCPCGSGKKYKKCCGE
ncbi:MAG TPA: SEC-C metal-binding domain-containing protein, partial [Candidatus Omnitrophota bacterium]|nr:SEC-C metal-binding domain-containing protein [Candidatus Omnitrophota bacterium]